MTDDATPPPEETPQQQDSKLFWQLVRLGISAAIVIIDWALEVKYGPPTIAHAQVFKTFFGLVLLIWILTVPDSREENGEGETRGRNSWWRLP